MKRVVQKSIDIAYDLLPEAWERRGENYQTFHFATLCKRNRIITVGQNQLYIPSPKAIYFGKKFRTPRKIEFPFIHAEVDCISKAWSRVHIDSSYTLVSIRLNRWGEFRLAKPCDDCWAVINGLGVRDVYWTTDEGIENV